MSTLVHVGLRATYLNATIIWPREETGLVVSLYTVKLPSRQSISGWDMFLSLTTADETMPHIGHPAFGGYCAIVDESNVRGGEDGVHGSASSDM